MKQEWRQHPLTEMLVKRLKEERKELQESWSRGEFTNGSLEKSFGMSSQAIGSLRAIDLVLSLIDDVVEE